MWNLIIYGGRSSSCSYILRASILTEARLQEEFTRQMNSILRGELELEHRTDSRDYHFDFPTMVRVERYEVLVIDSTFEFCRLLDSLVGGSHLSGEIDGTILTRDRATYRCTGKLTAERSERPILDADDRVPHTEVQRRLTFDDSKATQSGHGVVPSTRS